jgi:hypothetical protein
MLEFFGSSSAIKFLLFKIYNFSLNFKNKFESWNFGKDLKALTIFKNFSSCWSFLSQQSQEIIITSAAANKNIENESIASCGQPNQQANENTNKRINKYFQQWPQ